jgi:hypothetical protein
VYLQQRAGLKSQQALQQLDVYAAMVTEGNSMMNRSIDDSAFYKSKNRFFYELTPKIDFLFSEELGEEARKLNANIEAKVVIGKMNNLIATIWKTEVELGNYLISYNNVDNYPPATLDSPYMAQKEALEGLICSMISKETLFSSWKSIYEGIDTSTAKWIDKYQNRYAKQLSIYTDYKNDCLTLTELLAKGIDAKVKPSFSSLCSKMESKLDIMAAIAESYRKQDSTHSNKIKAGLIDLQRQMRKQNLLLK